MATKSTKSVVGKTTYKDVFGDKPVKDIIAEIEGLDRRGLKRFQYEVINSVEHGDPKFTSIADVKKIVDAVEAREAELERLDAVKNAGKALEKLSNSNGKGIGNGKGDIMTDTNFSFTALIFGCIVPLFRLDWISFWTTFVLTGIFMGLLIWGWSGLAYFGGTGGTASNLVAVAATLPMVIMHIFLGFRYNDMYRDFS